VLHQEILVNLVDGRPVPNFLVYPRPWYRDGAMMAMVLERTGNLALIKNWIVGLREPFDRNNAGEREADNPGEILYLISRVADRGHPLVPVVLRELKNLEKDGHIAGRTDFASHPAYQTQWAKLGARAIGLPDPYTVPATDDSYRGLCWWGLDQVDQTKPVRSVADLDYPYLTWARAHYGSRAVGPISDRDYPLTWEANASQAAYQGMRLIDERFFKSKICAPHTWHAAEMFLAIQEKRMDRQKGMSRP
jgi:hypothetical protein